MTTSTVLCIVIGCLAVISGIIALVNAFHTAEVDNCECDMKISIARILSLIQKTSSSNWQ